MKFLFPRENNKSDHEQLVGASNNGTQKGKWFIQIKQIATKSFQSSRISTTNLFGRGSNIVCPPDSFFSGRSSRRQDRSWSAGIGSIRLARGQFHCWSFSVQVIKLGKTPKRQKSARA